MNCPSLDLKKKSDVHYLSELGYYILNENKTWIFIPFEKEFNKEMLLEIIKKLEYLNN